MQECEIEGLKGTRGAAGSYALDDGGFGGGGDGIWVDVRETHFGGCGLVEKGDSFGRWGSLMWIRYSDAFIMCCEFIIAREVDERGTYSSHTWEDSFLYVFYFNVRSSPFEGRNAEVFALNEG